MNVHDTGNLIGLGITFLLLVFCAWFQHRHKHDLRLSNCAWRHPYYLEGDCDGKVHCTALEHSEPPVYRPL